MQIRAIRLFVSALNHTFHESGDPNNNGLSTRRYSTDENGDIESESLNYFKRGTTLYNRAESEPLSKGELQSIVMVIEGDLHIITILIKVIF